MGCVFAAEISDRGKAPTAAAIDDILKILKTQGFSSWLATGVGWFTANKWAQRYWVSLVLWL